MGVTGRRTRGRRDRTKSIRRAEPAEPAEPAERTGADGASPQALSTPNTLGELTHWNSAQRGASVVLLGAGLASALAAAFGWMTAGVGYALGVVFALAGLFVRFGRETLADRTPRQAVWIGVSVVIVAALLSVVMWYFRPRQSNIIVLERDLNVAVLPFAIEGHTGEGDGAFGSSFAGGVADALLARTEAELEGTGIRPDIKAMDVELDLSQVPADLAARGAAIAAEAGADFVLTGVISSNELGTVVRPLVFVAPERVPDAPELSGWYDGGVELTADPDLATNLQSQGRAYHDMRDAMGTLIDVGLALEDLAAGRAEGAADRLEAVDRGGNFHIIPHELVLLLLGNALGREACPAGRCDEERLERAADAYQQSAEGPSGLARGRVGLGELALQRGQGGGGCGVDEIDGVALDEAESLFRGVIDDPATPPVARAKAQLGLARVDACRTAAGIEGAGSSVQSIAETLVAQADAGDMAVRHLAAEARSFEAVVATVQGRADEARRALDDAIERSTDLERRADWMELRAQLLSQPATCDLPQAVESLEEAITIRDRLIDQADGRLLRILETAQAEAGELLASLRGQSSCG